MSVLHFLQLPLKGCADQAPFLAAGWLIALEAVTPLGPAPWTYQLDGVAVAAGEGIEFFNLPPAARDDAITPVILYSSHIAPTRQSVVAEAWSALKPKPLLSVAGVIISPPGGATHRKVALWLSGSSSTSVLEV